MQRNKVTILVILVIALALMNLLLLGMMWKFMKREQHPRQTPRDLILRELRLSPEQAAAFEVLREEHFSEVQRLRGLIRSEKEALFGQLRNDRPDTSEVAAHMRMAAAYEMQVDQVTFVHFQKVRALCNVEQQQRFDSIIGEVLRIMGRPHGPGGPPPPRPD